MSKAVMQADEALYRRLRVLRDTLTELDRLTVDKETVRGTAYVWGRQDERGGDRDTQESITFGRAYGLHEAEYRAGIRGSRYSVQDAYDLWQAGQHNPTDWVR